MQLRKPRVVGDIQSSKRSVFRPAPDRVNLSYHEVWRLPVTRFAKCSIVFIASWFLILGSVVAPTSPSLIIAANKASTVVAPHADERQALEAQLRDLESQIDKYEQQISSYRKQGTSLKGEIARLNSKIAKLHLQVKAINIELSDLDQKIDETKSKIAGTEANIQTNKETLTALLRNINEYDKASAFEIFLKNPRLSDFFNDFHSISVLQGKVRVSIRQISDLRDSLKDQQTQYALARADAATLKAYQLAQVAETDQATKEKKTLLEVTKGQESKYQSLLKLTKETAAQIRSRIFQLLGGGELSFEDAYQYAKLASGATGVRPALILAVLDRESALGRNVGKCSYKTAMSPASQTAFLAITKELGIDPETITVSCANADGVYGGAMGPAQFVPNTWMLYKSQIEKVIGKAPASPWNNSDAFIATALYLKDAGAADTNVSGERKAAAKYYAGGNWRRYLWTYGEAVVSKAQRFQQDIDTINE